MKKAPSLLALLITANTLFAQVSDDNPTRFSFVAAGCIGYGIVDNKNEPNYNINSNNGTVLINYRFARFLGAATGFGINSMSGDGFNSHGNFHHERELAQIPLLLTTDVEISDQLRFLLSVGPYVSSILKDEYRYLNETEKNVYDGWNVGLYLGFGFLYNLSEDFSVGMNYQGQSNFIEMSSNQGKTIDDNQKIRYLNSIGLSFVLDF